jgi:hypothetical protein
MAKHDIGQWQEGQSPQEIKERCSQAGKASGKRRRYYRSLQEGLKAILPLEIDSQQAAQELKELGLEPTFTNAISLRLVRKVLEEGNVTAFQALRDTVGEKPGDKTRIGDKPVEGMDLSRLTDQQLAQLADREEEA